MSTSLLLSAAEKAQVRRLLDMIGRGSTMCGGCGRKLWFVVAKEHLAYVAVDDDATAHDPECKGPLRSTRRVA